jgi:primosomal protein N' (replication factor Y)
MPEFVDVAVPVGVRKTFVYSVPPRFREKIAVGMRVLVPFGRKLVTGYAVGTPISSQSRSFRIRAVQELLEPEPAIPPSLVETALWIASYYFAPPGEVFRALFPAGTQVFGVRKVSITPRAAALINGGLRPVDLCPQENRILEVLAQRESLSLKELARCTALRNPEQWIESLAAANWIQVESFLQRPKVTIKEQLSVRILKGVDHDEDLPPAQKRFYSLLESRAHPVLLQEALRSARATQSAARALARKGLIEISAERIDRRPAELLPIEDTTAPALTPLQQDLVDRVIELILQNKPSRFLIHGVTGSGKTEIYLRLISEVLKRGESALFLVPEIGLTPILTRLVVSRFPNRVSLLHSGMSAGERFDQWTRIRRKEARVVVGTRSAVFAPVEDLRLIVIDEEQDSSYKQDESPCYHAREVAWHRVQQSGGVLLMGSATPAIETFFAARHMKDTGLFSLPERIEARPLPPVTIVDMSREFQRCGKNRVISETLQSELESCLQRGEQSIVLLNRRGFSRTILCRSCGHVYMCPDCSISMTYHQQEDRLICHYCGQQRSVPSQCGNCGGPYIHYAGVGTEQLENIVRTALPKARIARVDRDTARRRGFLRTTLFDFAEHRIDVLVGTQMLAKGHDFPNVTLVGVVAADAGLAFPDFRSAERTFQLLIQVAGRAGRGTAPGRVIIQSYHPDNYALQFAQNQDYRGFYEREIEFRRLMGYPPFSRLVQILISDPDSVRACDTAEKIAQRLKLHVARSDARFRPHVLGPAAAPIEKIRGNYRMQILLKCRPESVSASLLRECFDELEHKKFSSKVHVDVDPLSLL